MIKIIQKLEYLIQEQGKPTTDWKKLNSQLLSLDNIYNAVAALPQVVATMFKDKPKMAEEAAKIPSDICARCTSGLLRDLSDQLTQCTLKQRPALFYDPLANKMVFSVTAEHMQLAEIWQTQQKLQFSDYEVP